MIQDIYSISNVKIATNWSKIWYVAAEEKLQKWMKVLDENSAETGSFWKHNNITIVTIYYWPQTRGKYYCTTTQRLRPFVRAFVDHHNVVYYVPFGVAFLLCFRLPITRCWRSRTLGEICKGRLWCSSRNVDSSRGKSEKIIQSYSTSSTLYEYYNYNDIIYYTKRVVYAICGGDECWGTIEVPWTRRTHFVRYDIYIFIINLV